MIKQIDTVTFHGTPLTVITDNCQQLVAMKPIVEAIGLQWEAQYKRIQRHPVLSACMSIMDIQLPTDTQKRKVAFLPIDYLNGWLFGVDVNRVRKEIRDTLIQYQRECYAVLAAYWQTGEAKAPSKRKPKALPNGLSIDQQDTIKAMVKARVEALPANKRAKAAITCWSALKSKFGCTYKDINSDQFTDAASLVARVALEGEFLEKELEAQKRLNIHYPVSFLTKQHPEMLKAYSDSHDYLEVTLEQLDERSTSAVESILHELNNAGYQIDAAWFEIRTYRNKMLHLKRALSVLQSALESPQDYLVNKT